MEFKSIRRVVVGHDPKGKAVAVFDGDVAPKQRSPGGNAVANLWITNEFPVDPNGQRYPFSLPSRARARQPPIPASSDAGRPAPAG